MDSAILIIAGSDSCAGAGMEIDLKTASALGTYATCAITAITAQNTLGVEAVQAVDPDVIEGQIEAACSDIPPKAIKIGMLGNAEAAAAVACALSRHPEIPAVIDPVLAATSGGALATEGVIDALQNELFAKAALVTPNMLEAQKLTGMNIRDARTMELSAQKLHDFGARAVLIKGGHGSDSKTVTDRLYEFSGGFEPSSSPIVHEFTSPRLEGEFHGTGCCLSTSIACFLAKGNSLADAVGLAHEFLHQVLENPTNLGHGSHIINPFAAAI